MILMTIGAPRIVRSDCGTENVNIAFMQPYLRHNHGDCFAGALSFRYGKSVTNQRIEAWWSQLKKWCTQWWHELFKNMEHEGFFDGTYGVHVDCLRFAFMELVQQDLNRVVTEWNSHFLRSSRRFPGGHPNELYFLPELHGTEDYLLAVSNGDIAVANEYVEEPAPPASLEFLQLAEFLLRERALQMPSSIEEAIKLYLTLVDIIDI